MKEPLPDTMAAAIGERVESEREATNASENTVSERGLETRKRERRNFRYLASATRRIFPATPFGIQHSQHKQPASQTGWLMGKWEGSLLECQPFDGETDDAFINLGAAKAGSRLAWLTADGGHPGGRLDALIDT